MSLDFSLEVLRPYEIYSINITHNLNEMAHEAGLYYCLWWPHVRGYKKAKDIITPLRKGLGLLKSNPERFKKYEPENGWGSYYALINFAAQTLEACEDNPEAVIRVCC